MKSKFLKKVLFFSLLLVGIFQSCKDQKHVDKATASAMDDSKLQALAEQAYTFTLPIIMSYKTMYYYSVDTTTKQFKAPFNVLKNKARVYDPENEFFNGDWTIPIIIITSSK